MKSPLNWLVQVQAVLDALFMQVLKLGASHERVRGWLNEDTGLAEHMRPHMEDELPVEEAAVVAEDFLRYQAPAEVFDGLLTVGEEMLQTFMLLADVGELLGNLPRSIETAQTWTTLAHIFGPTEDEEGYMLREKRLTSMNDLAKDLLECLEELEVESIIDAELVEEE